MYYIVHSK